MGVESATYVNDFDTSLPGSSDVRSQGDDHLRLLKTVLKTTFTGATRTFQIPTTLSKSANYSIVKADGESTIYCNTGSGDVTFTLPTLAALDAGWKVHFIKTNSGANPMFIAPPSGTINSGGISGLAKCRRAVPGLRITAIWDGSTFFVTRALTLPIGSVIEYNGSSLPAGYEWPNGQTLSSASTNYPEYNSVMGSGVTLDDRGRVAAGKDNMGGSSADRLTNANDGLDGDTLGATGGGETQSLVTANLPAYTPAGSIANGAITISGQTSLRVVAGDNNNNGGGGGTFGAMSSTPPTLTASQASSTFTGTAQGGTSTAFGVVQPTIIKNKLLVVE